MLLQFQLFCYINFMYVESAWQKSLNYYPASNYILSDKISIVDKIVYTGSRTIAPRKISFQPWN